MKFFIWDYEDNWYTEKSLHELNQIFISSPYDINLDYIDEEEEEVFFKENIDNI